MRGSRWWLVGLFLAGLGFYWGLAAVLFGRFSDDTSVFEMLATFVLLLILVGAAVMAGWVCASRVRPGCSWTCRCEGACRSYGSW